MRLSDLQNKDLINIIDGKKIGSIIDASFNVESGLIEKLMIEPSKSLFSLKSNILEIKFSDIVKIGEDVILINYNWYSWQNTCKRLILWYNIYVEWENPLFNLIKGGLMKEKVVAIIGNSLEKLNLFVDDVVYEKENNVNYLRICLDSKDIIDVNLIVSATKIINPLIDEADLINEEYILDIYGKSKGE